MLIKAAAVELLPIPTVVRCFVAGAERAKGGALDQSASVENRLAGVEDKARITSQELQVCKSPQA